MQVARSVVAAVAAGVLTAGCQLAADTQQEGSDEGGGPSESTASPSPSPTEAATPTTPPATPPPATPTPDAAAPEPPDGQALAAAESTPVEDPYYPEMSNPEVDALHYNLQLAWDGSRLKGTTTLTFRATVNTDQIRLDLASALTAVEVRLDGEPVEVVQRGDGLEIDTGVLSRDSRHEVTIAYAGTPQPTPAPSMRTDMGGGLGWTVDPDGSVHTFQEPYGAFTWYPVNDHPSDEALYDAQITTPAGTTGVFNGELVGVDARDTTTTASWHLDEPAASYLTTIAIGAYTEYEQRLPGGTVVSHWLLPADRRLLPRLKRDTAAAFPWLEEKAGRYPFDTLGVVVVGGTSAMETQTMITMSRGAVIRPDAVLQHEIAHQWYGNAVTPEDWRGLWLNEGWAMYMQQWFEDDTGRYEYAGGIENWRSIDQEARTNSGPPGNYDPRSFGDSNVYLGPALMLDSIRRRVGDRVFERLVKAWPADHDNATVDRADFETWLEAETGQEFGPFLARWLDGTRTPLR